MLSVRHIQLSGHEDIYLASRVSFQPEMDNPSQSAQRGGVIEPERLPPTIFLDCPNGETMPIHGGTIFVMNDAGKTVARYDIGASMVPLDGGEGPKGIRIA